MGSRISHVSSAAVIDCASEIKKLALGLTEGEIIQIVNLKPESEVEYYLVNDSTLLCCNVKLIFFLHERR
jgi:hypothetical protein